MLFYAIIFQKTSDIFVNIEVRSELPPKDFNEFVNKYWADKNKLKKLVGLGDILELGKTIKDTISSASEFIRINKSVVKRKSGDDTLYYDTKYPQNSLLIVECTTNTLDEVIADAKFYDWSYLFVLNENSDSFNCVKCQIQALCSDFGFIFVFIFLYL